VRPIALLLATLALAGCGSTGSTGEFGEVKLVMPARQTADDVGVYFATSRGYDEAEGVTLEPTRDQATADFRIAARPPANCVAVLAIVQPDKLVLCVDKFILSDDPDKVKAVAAALQRGYTQAQLEPDEAAAAMNISAADVEDAAPTWTAGASKFGALKPGPGRQPLY